MKRIISILLVLFFALSLTACGEKGKPEELNETLYNYAINAVETVDDFLDGTISVEKAEAKISSIMLYTDSYKSTKDGNSVDDVCVSMDIFFLKHELYLYRTGDGSKEKITEQRNDLAESINKSKR